MFSNELWQKSGVSTYSIDQSIRFNDDDSPILKKTYSSAGTEETFTFSCWVKRGNIGAGLGGAGNYGITLFSGGSNTSNYGEIRFESSNGIGTQDSLFFYNVTGGSINMQLATTQLFRDTSAWYHIVCVMDTTNDISTERMRIYVNGSRVTDFGTETYPSQNTVPNFNTATEHGVGGFAVGTDTRFFDGYLAEIVFIDGTALDPSSFGEYNDSNIWIPKDVSGLTFGTNGFHIDGRDASGTPVKLGDDEAGSNNYTTSGMDASDQKKDSPTNNHATWNPLTTSAQAYTNGNLNAASSSSAWKGGLATVQVPLNSGTWYYEVYIDSAGSSSGQFSVGWSESNRSLSDNNSSGDTEGWVTYALNGNYYSNGGNGSYGATYTTGNVIGCKIDTNSSTNNVEFYKDGASQGTLSQAFNTGGTGFISPYILLYGTRNATARFAQAEWTQTPSGITEANAINTSNLGS